MSAVMSRGTRSSVSAGKKKKRGGGLRLDGLLTGFLAARAREEDAGLAQLGWLGWPFSIFFERTFSLFFQNSKTNTSFDLKLQMSSNQFLNFCKNKIHSTRHTHLVFLKNKIKGSI